MDGRAGIDAQLVERLVASQLPQWAHLPVRPVEADGWDNRTYRLGETMTVRLPTAAGYVPAVAKEDRWLPVLAPQLPVPVPVPLATGGPGHGYPFPWSVRPWLDGEPATPGDHVRLGIDLAHFLGALHDVDPTGGPVAGAHSFHRGASLSTYDGETRSCLARLGDRVDTGAATAVWEAALASVWPGPPTWFHGDVAAGNLLVEDGRLVAVIDFGTCGVGDPACDLVATWTLFEGESRLAFRRAVGQDEGTWARARGWALWKALLGLVPGAAPESAAASRRVVAAVLTEPIA